MNHPRRVRLMGEERRSPFFTGLFFGALPLLLFNFSLIFSPFVLDVLNASFSVVFAIIALSPVPSLATGRNALAIGLLVGFFGGIFVSIWLFFTVFGSLE